MFEPSFPIEQNIYKWLTNVFIIDFFLPSAKAFSGILYSIGEFLFLRDRKFGRAPIPDLVGHVSTLMR